MRTPAGTRFALFAGVATPRLLAAAVALAAAVGALACGQAPEPVRDVRVRVEGVGIDANDLPVLVLEELGGPRWLPIWIGDPEARAIARHIEAIESPRPDTHELARRVIDGLHGEVEHVVVTDLRAGTYYAVIRLRADGRRVEIDARPSDAVALALRAGAPIFVREPLFEHDAGDRPPSERESSI